MEKSKNCVRVKYKNGETKEISNVDIKDFFNRVEGVGFFYKINYDTSLSCMLENDSIQEVVFQNFNFFVSSFCNFNLPFYVLGITVVFDHCNFGNFQSFDNDNVLFRNGCVVFDSCSAEKLSITADRVVMKGNTIAATQASIHANNVFIEGDVDTERLSICSEVVYIDDANLRLSSIHVDTQSLAFSDSTLLATNINLKYKNLFTYHSSFTSPKYQFNGDTWSFGEKIKISSDDVICDVDFARVRFLKSLKKYQAKVNDCYSDVVKTSLDEVNQGVDLEIQEYQKQIDALEVKKIEANRGRSSLKQEKLRVLSNKKALGFLSSR